MAVGVTREPVAPNPLLVAQGVARQPLSLADLPRPAQIAAGTPIQPLPLPATPAAALAQMIPEAMARQNSIAPLMASLASMVARPGALPEPVLRAALQVLGARMQIPPNGPTGQMIETAVAKSGVYLEATLAKGTPPSADLKAGLVALKGALATWLGANPAPVTAVQRVAPPLRGVPPRVEVVASQPLPEAPREAARLMHSQADAALSRVKLMQLASLPDADPIRTMPQELRTEVPFLVGQELVMAQFQVFRDGARRKSEGKRGWTMRFAINSAVTGEVGAEIGLLGRAVNVALWAAEPGTAADLAAALPELGPCARLPRPRARHHPCPLAATRSTEGRLRAIPGQQPMNEEPKKPAIAVALEYEPGTREAPRVVATGRGLVAERIVEIARESGVTIEGNPMLAEALSGVAIDDTIPHELYQAVAEVIGFVLRTQDRR